MFFIVCNNIIIHAKFWKTLKKDTDHFLGTPTVILCTGKIPVHKLKNMERPAIVYTVYIYGYCRTIMHKLELLILGNKY